MIEHTKKVGEIFWIGDEINITVLGVRGQQVRFGIAAPKQMKINRKEVSKKIRAASVNAQADHKVEFLCNESVISERKKT